jgi:hypothetical protein
VEQEMHKDFLGEYLAKHQLERPLQREEDNTEIIIIYRQYDISWIAQWWPCTLAVFKIWVLNRRIFSRITVLPNLRDECIHISLRLLRLMDPEGFTED